MLASVASNTSPANALDGVGAAASFPMPWAPPIPPMVAMPGFAASAAVSHAVPQGQQQGASLSNGGAAGAGVSAAVSAAAVGTEANRSHLGGTGITKSGSDTLTAALQAAEAFATPSEDFKARTTPATPALSFGAGMQARLRARLGVGASAAAASNKALPVEPASAASNDAPSENPANTTSAFADMARQIVEQHNRAAQARVARAQAMALWARSQGALLVSPPMQTILRAPPVPPMGPLTFGTTGSSAAAVAPPDPSE